MAVVVFGAAGWLGRAMLANLAVNHDVRAVDLSPQSWDKLREVDGDWDAGEKLHGDIADFHFVRGAIEGMDAVVHTAVHFVGDNENDDAPFLVNLKGLWNVLECSHQLGIGRVVHVGSCGVAHPEGIFFTSEVRRPDGGLYATCKRLQEEMCRQFHEAHGLSIVVLRPSYIVDSRIGRGFYGETLGTENHRTHAGWVCRHDLAEACRLALEQSSQGQRSDARCSLPELLHAHAPVRRSRTPSLAVSPCHPTPNKELARLCDLAPRQRADSYPHLTPPVVSSSVALKAQFTGGVKCVRVSEQRGGWLVTVPGGYYDCSFGAEGMVTWKVGDSLVPFDQFAENYRRPDLARKALAGEDISGAPACSPSRSRLQRPAPGATERPQPVSGSRRTRSSPRPPPCSDANRRHRR